MTDSTIVDLREVNKTFNGPAGPIEALKKVSLKVYPGRICWSAWTFRER